MTDSLGELVHDLSAAPARAQRDVLAVVEHAAVNVKNTWRASAKAGSGIAAPAYPYSITYDISAFAALGGSIKAEVGPDKAKPQGPLGNLIEFGSVHNPPHNDGGRALRAEAAAFERGLAEVTLNALGWH